jgi:hypothetical protein
MPYETFKLRFEECGHVLNVPFQSDSALISDSHASRALPAFSFRRLVAHCQVLECSAFRQSQELNCRIDSQRQTSNSQNSRCGLRYLSKIQVVEFGCPCIRVSNNHSCSHKAAFPYRGRILNTDALPNWVGILRELPFPIK